MRVPELRGLIGAAAVAETAAHIASLQLPSGLIPWFDGHIADPWDHVESAMALTVSGLWDEARRAYEWSARTQSPDGGGPMEIAASGRVVHGAVDANQCAYLAVGVWHHWLVTGDRAFVDALWPVVRRAIDFVCDLQLEWGAVCWSRSADGEPYPQALLTGSACIVLALRCALAVAELLGDPHPDWELAAGRLAHAVARHEDAFADRSRYSMDWYYPILGGAVDGAEARARLAERWDLFVVPGRGARCVADRPWVTAAETCELVLTLDVTGDTDAAGRLLRDIQFTRAEDGGYWTGWVFPDDAFWPEERSTWTAGAVVLAADALARHTPGNGLFRGESVPQVWAMYRCDDNCYAPVGGG